MASFDSFAPKILTDKRKRRHIRIEPTQDGGYLQISLLECDTLKMNEKRTIVNNFAIMATKKV